MSDFRSYRPDAFPPVVKNLIIINALVFLAQVVLDSRFGITEKIQLYPLMPAQLRDILEQLGHPLYSRGQGFEPYQVATHMFAHGSFTHILFNMLTLWMFGRILENVWGAKRFLLFYLACGVGAAAAHLAMQYFRCEQLLHAIVAESPDWQNMIGATAPALGASGAIMGVVAAFAYLFPNTELFIMFIPFPVKAKYAVIGWFAIDLFGGIANISGDNIAHFAHLGGAITGFVLVLIWNKTNRQRFF